MNTVVEVLFAEFNEELRCNGSAVGPADFERFLVRCPETDRRELRSLMNVAYLTDRAFRQARRRAAKERVSVSATRTA